jgi:hypothetical protein
LTRALRIIVRHLKRTIYSASPDKLIAKALVNARIHEPPLQAPNKAVSFPQHAQQNAFRRRYARQQQRSFGYKQQLTEWASKHSI